MELNQDKMESKWKLGFISLEIILYIENSVVNNANLSFKYIFDAFYLF